MPVAAAAAIILMLMSWFRAMPYTLCYMIFTPRYASHIIFATLCFTLHMLLFFFSRYAMPLIFLVDDTRELRHMRLLSMLSTPFFALLLLRHDISL